MNKIYILLKKKKQIIAYGVVALLLIYTRFVNLGWGLPYPFHPDERNMADALTQLHCTGWNSECFNPHFFAYGQFPLYLGYAGIQVYHFIFRLPHIISFSEAVLSLRVLSAIASLGVCLVLVKTLMLFLEMKPFIVLKKNVDWILYLGALVFIFSPGFIQFAHFGTTESLLMLFYSILIYLSLMIQNGRHSMLKFAAYSGLVCGLALATKSSALSFIALPALTIIFTEFSAKKPPFIKKIIQIFSALILMAVVSIVFAIIFSPFNFIALNDFLGSMRYESAVGLGSALVFYTRQFQMTLPILFQFTSIFPYVLGIPVLLLFLAGFLFLPRKKEFHILRIAFLLYFLPSAIIFAKWTRFMAPVLPVMLMTAMLFLLQFIVLFKRKFKQEHLAIGLIVLTFIIILPGFAYLSVYQKPDIRFTASEWIYNNIPANSIILSETANVVDLPIIPPEKLNTNAVFPNYQNISFNFYDIDVNEYLYQQLQTAISDADFIIIPSRRIFANHTCTQKSITNIILGDIRCRYFRQNYPLLNSYYENLFTGKLGFVQVKEFDSSPELSFMNWKVHFSDEAAEETWTVFDHPTIRIYKRSNNNANLR